LAELTAQLEAVMGVKMSNKSCGHMDQIKSVTPGTDGCAECLASGDSWVHLRLCMTCGHVGCCDSSKNKHATKHFHATNHPIIKSFEPGEDWGWCYVDEMMFESIKGGESE
jgi:uncharacterized UBP type Zn finger protein